MVEGPESGGSQVTEGHRDIQKISQTLLCELSAHIFSFVTVKMLTYFIVIVNTQNCILHGVYQDRALTAIWSLESLQGDRVVSLLSG